MLNYTKHYKRSNCYAQKIVDAFAWKPEDMTRNPRSLIEHCLIINSSNAPIKQKKHGMAKERNKIVNVEVKALVEVGFMRATQFPKWIAYPVLVRNMVGMMRMCADFTDLNKVCPKCSYLLPKIEQNIELLVGFK